MIDEAAEGGSLFVTGRAGTGKSTLLRCLKRNLPQNTAVLAPTLCKNKRSPDGCTTHTEDVVGNSD